MILKKTRKSVALYPKSRKKYMCQFSSSGSHIRFYQSDGLLYDYTGPQLISESKNFVNEFVNNTWAGSNENIVIMSSSERSGSVRLIKTDVGEYGDVNGANQRGLKLTFNASGENNYAFLSSSYIKPMEVGKKYVFDARFISDGVPGYNLVAEVSNSVANGYETFIINGGYITASNSSGSGKIFTNLLDTNGGYLSEYRIAFNLSLISGSFPTMSLVNNNNNSETAINTGNILAYSGSNTHVLKLNTLTTSSVYLRFMNNSYTDFVIDNFSIKKLSNPRVTVKLGDISKTVQITSVNTTSWTPIIINFTSSVSSSNKDIQIYTDIPDTIHMVRPILAKSYDFAITTAFKQFNEASGLQVISARGDANTREAGWTLYTQPSNNSMFCRYGDGYAGISVTTPSNVYQKNVRTNLSWVLDRTGFATIYINGVPIVSASAAEIGASYGFYQSSIGGATYTAWLTGNIMDFQVLKFDNISQSNFNPITYLSNGINVPIGGSTQNVITMNFDPTNLVTVLDSFEPVFINYYNFGSSDIVLQ